MMNEIAKQKARQYITKDENKDPCEGNIYGK